MTRLLEVAVLASTVCGLVACGNGAVLAPPKPPEWEAGGQAKCSVQKSASEPLVVEWPSADRAKLEAKTREGLVAVHYSGCELRVLGQCRVSGRYGFVGTTAKKDRETIRTSDELFAKLPLGAARLEGTLARSGTLDVRMSIVGRYSSDRPIVDLAELEGACEGATHVVAGVIVGAFSFEAGAANAAGASGGAFGAEAGGRAEAERSVLSSDGLEASCENASPDAQAPPVGCAALLRIELAPIREPAGIAEKRDRERQAKEDALTHERANRESGRTAGWVLMGSGAAAALGGGVLHFLHYDKERKIEAGGYATGADIETAQASSKLFNVLSIVATSLGVLAIGSGLWVRVANSEPEPNPRAGLRVRFGGSSAGIVFP